MRRHPDRTSLRPPQPVIALGLLIGMCSGAHAAPERFVDDGRTTRVTVRLGPGPGPGGVRG